MSDFYPSSFYKSSSVNTKEAITLAACLSILTSITPAMAQDDMRQGLKPFAEISSLDDRGVDVASGFAFFNLADVGIGNLQHMIVSRPDRLEPYYDVVPLMDNYAGFIFPVFRAGTHNADCEDGAVDVMTGNVGKIFCVNFNGSYAPHIEDGSTLSQNPDGSFLYTNSSGVKYYFSTNMGPFERLTQVEQPNGERVDIHFKQSSPVEGRTHYRIQSVTNNYGYQLKYVYSRNTAGTVDELRDWVRPAQIVAVNNAVDYCAPTADNCSFSRAWPTATHSWSASTPYEDCVTETDPKGDGTKAPEDPAPKPVTTCTTRSDETYINITNAANLTVKYTLDIGGRVTKVEQPDGRTIEYSYCSGDIEPGVECDFLEEARTGFGRHKNKVISVNDDGVIWDYSYRDVNSVNGITLHDYGSEPPTDLDGGKRVYAKAFNLNSQLSFLERIVEGPVAAYFSPDSKNRLTSLTQVDSFDESYEYDSRGNVIKTTRTGVGETPIITEANFDPVCTNPAKCNNPNWTTDGKGNRTDYVYDANGMIKSMTMAADDLGRRPQIRFFYEQRYAYIKNASGSMVPASSPIWVLKSESTCRNSAAQGNGCADPNEEVQMVTEYGSGTQANNLIPKGIVVTSTDGVRRTCYRHDALGNITTETSPLANLSVCP